MKNSKIAIELRIKDINCERRKKNYAKEIENVFEKKINAIVKEQKFHIPVFVSYTN